MNISNNACAWRNHLRGPQSADAAIALHQVISIGQKRLVFSDFIKRTQFGIRLAPGSMESGCLTNHLTKWRKSMLRLMPSIDVGLVGGVLTAILLAVDWYIWYFRYRISPQPAPDPTPPPDGEDIIHVPSVSSRELVVALVQQCPEQNALPVHQVEGEWSDVWAQG